MPAELYIGTSSWAEKALVDSKRFYPSDVKDTPARLEFYAQRFTFAEIDSTYYALPSKKNIQRWEDKHASTLERFDWLYSEQELSEWLPRIEQLRAESDSLYLGFSTKADDQGVVNAQHLKKLLRLA